MKYVISFFFCANVMAAPIHVYYEIEPSRAQSVKDIFTDQYLVPEDLIDLKEVPLCENLKSRGKLDLCLKNNGDLIVVSVDRGFINESLKIFRAP